MIRKLGIAFFGVLALALFAIGLVQHQPAAMFLGGLTVFFILVLVLGSTVFRRWMDTKESGDVGMKVIRKAASRSVGRDGD